MSNYTEIEQQISETLNTSANPNTIMNTSPQISSSQTVSNLVTSVEQIIANIKQLQTSEMQLYINLDNQNLTTELWTLGCRPSSAARLPLCRPRPWL